MVEDAVSYKIIIPQEDAPAVVIALKNAENTCEDYLCCLSGVSIFFC